MTHTQIHFYKQTIISNQTLTHTECVKEMYARELKLLQRI